MKSRSFKITCWKWLYRHTRQLRWLVGLIWPLHTFPHRLALELELRRCEASWEQ
jgi:hypothetical protein